jgi:hypothetical protein
MHDNCLILQVGKFREKELGSVCSIGLCEPLMTLQLAGRGAQGAERKQVEAGSLPKYCPLSMHRQALWLTVYTRPFKKDLGS